MYWPAPDQGCCFLLVMGRRCVICANILMCGWSVKVNQTYPDTSAILIGQQLPIYTQIIGCDHVILSFSPPRCLHLWTSSGIVLYYLLFHFRWLPKVGSFTRTVRRRWTSLAKLASQIVTLVLKCPNISFLVNGNLERLTGAEHRILFVWL